MTYLQAGAAWVATIVALTVYSVATNNNVPAWLILGAILSLPFWGAFVKDDEGQ